MKYDLIFGEAIEKMSIIANQSIDLILTDLPYGETSNEEDIIIPFSDLWNGFNRIIKDNGVVLLFGQGLFYIDLVNSNRDNFKYDIIWDKILTSNHLNANKMPLRQHEHIAVFYKKRPTYNPQFTVGEPLHPKGKKYLHKNNTNNNYNYIKNIEDNRCGETKKYPKSILSYQKPHPSIALHRTEKSIPLLENLIKTYSNEQDIVLDCCMGSGTTGVACVNTNRNFIGIEKKLEYFNISKKRIEDMYYEKYVNDYF